jgi:hypothetical protein
MHKLFNRTRIINYTAMVLLTLWCLAVGTIALLVILALF